MKLRRRLTVWYILYLKVLRSLKNMRETGALKKNGSGRPSKCSIEKKKEIVAASINTAGKRYILIHNLYFSLNI